jgi:hypothetical protein
MMLKTGTLQLKVTDQRKQRMIRDGLFQLTPANCYKVNAKNHEEIRQMINRTQVSPVPL